jgi:glycosyltransferase involved in cell wall biosynthesis
LKYGRKPKADLVVLYDPFALLAFYFIKKIRRNKKIWYHNHDMPDKQMAKRYSIGSLSAKYEKKAMNYIDLFSLPSKERLKYYGDINKNIPVFIIPNYPSLKVYANYKIPSKDKETIKIIFQGFIGAGHSLEELVELLQENIGGCSLQLVLKGSVTDKYKSSLNELADKYNVAHKLIWLPIGPYAELPSITASCNIGIGINRNTDIISQAQGTASNKIYEYAASGLAVIVSDSLQFREYLDAYKWAFFTDGSVISLRRIIEVIKTNLDDLGSAARKSFEQNLNFEKEFNPAFQKIMAASNKRDSNI